MLLVISKAGANDAKGLEGRPSREFKRPRRGLGQSLLLSRVRRIGVVAAAADEGIGRTVDGMDETVAIDGEEDENKWRSWGISQTLVLERLSLRRKSSSRMKKKQANEEVLAWNKWFNLERTLAH
jgi:hypothetical protein